MLLFYLRRPRLVSAPSSVWNPVFILLRLSFICVLVGGMAGYISETLVFNHLIPDPGPSILDHRDVSQFQFFMGAVFVAPVIEEWIFRAQLKRFSATILFMTFILGLICSAVAKTYWAFLVSPVIFGIVFILYRFTIAGSVTQKFIFWNRIFPWHFHLTAICFALVHLANFEKGIALLPLGILYTLPQLAIGLVLGFTRMCYGLKYSIALHSLYNLFFTILLFIKQ
ncbi:CPBP family glutamic-type intramembrane protease [Pedobacter hartonius]|nr:CPBP family glutamic-type intramembrane protease [Pedobacter hartonius]